MTSIQQIIADVASGKLTPEQGEAAIAALEREESGAQAGAESAWTVVDDADELKRGERDRPFAERARGSLNEQSERIEDWADSLAQNAMNLAESITQQVNQSLGRMSITVDRGAGSLSGDVPGIPEGQSVRGDVRGNVLGDIGAGARIDGDVLGGVQGDIGTGARIKGDVHGGIGGGMQGIIDGDLMGDVQGDLDGTVRGDVDGSVHGNLSGVIKGDLTGTVHGDFSGAVRGDMDGDVLGSFTGEVSGDFTGVIHGDLRGVIHGDLQGKVEGSVYGRVSGDVHEICGDIAPGAEIGGDVDVLRGHNYGKVRGEIVQEG